MEREETRLLQSNRTLAATAAFALAVVVVRACVQSITIDEADTFHQFVNRPFPAHWYPASNNHVLNSMLMTLFTSVFGPSHLALRAPAILGASLYIGSAHTLCRLTSGRLFIQWPLFVCLVFNPFVLDYLIAARGYSLALGFLLASLTAAASLAKDPLRFGVRGRLAAASLCSVCAALSFGANFSYAFANAGVVVAGACWACARGERVAR